MGAFLKMTSSPVMYVALIQDLPPANGEEKTVAIVAAAHDVSSLSLVTRGSAKEIMRFSARSVALALQPGNMIKASANNDFAYCVYGLKNSSGTTAILVANTSYAIRFANHYLKEILSLAMNLPPNKLNVSKDAVGPKEDGGLVDLVPLLKRAQRPEENDQLSKLAKDIDEVRDMAYANLEKIVERGRSLDEVMKKSDDLSAASKMFLKEAKKTNCRLCAVL
ncbi:Putative synaptobrevin family protein [Giardia duodenalis]|uniref:Putative synaptobrevin family protein n=1 Tax=Giardia intestinalis TaxID=5741 RepID=V6TJ86_GIAIN|nr:Putative synaptobrevin family protein [Giardia intestinalis]